MLPTPSMFLPPPKKGNGYKEEGYSFQWFGGTWCNQYWQSGRMEQLLGLWYWMRRHKKEKSPHCDPVREPSLWLLPFLSFPCALWLSLVWMKVGWFSKLLWSNPTMWKVIATDICIQGCFKAAWFLLFKMSLNSTDPASAHKTKNKTLINDGGSLIPPRYVAGVVLPSPI